MEDRKSQYIAVAIFGVAFLSGAFWGLKSLFYILAALVMFFTCVAIYQHAKKKGEATRKKDNSIKEDYKEQIGGVVIALIALFAIVCLGNCVGRCTKGGHHDSRQQRIEMGLPPY